MNDEFSGEVLRIAIIAAACVVALTSISALIAIAAWRLL